MFAILSFWGSADSAETPESDSGQARVTTHWSFRPKGFHSSHCEEHGDAAIPHDNEIASSLTPFVSRNDAFFAPSAYTYTFYFLLSTVYCFHLSSSLFIKLLITSEKSWVSMIPSRFRSPILSKLASFFPRFCRI